MKKLKSNFSQLRGMLSAERRRDFRAHLSLKSNLQSTRDALNRPQNAVLQIYTKVIRRCGGVFEVKEIWESMNRIFSKLVQMLSLVFPAY